MDALILSCGTGGGHNSAGLAVAEELTSRGHHAQMLNPYTLKSDRTAEVINSAYIKLVQNIPKAFGAVYSLGKLYRHLPFRSPVYHINKQMAPVMEKYMSENHFDAVIMSHLFPGEILTGMKRLGFALPPTVYIATDYASIPFTEEAECDYYIIPSPDLTDDFVHYGLSRDKLYPFGIPVRKQFASAPDRSAARKMLGLDAQARYILVCGGSMGAGNFSDIVDLLMSHYSGSDTTPIVICGTNQKLYDCLHGKYADKLLLLHHTDQIAAYMKACDLVISKPGGLSSTEAAVCGTALIHTGEIPGCESCNMDFFASRGMSIAVHSPNKQLIPACDRLLNDFERQRMTENQHKYINPRSAADICDLLEKGVCL